MRRLANDRLDRSMASRPRPHGTRARYQQDCRCFHCKLACAKYEAERKAKKRAGEKPNGIVLADRARDHLLRLSRAGIGVRTVHAVTDIHPWKLQRIRSGAQQHLRAHHERKILAVTEDMRADGARVKATRMRRQISSLKNEGFTYSELARRTGASRSCLVVRKPFVAARTALRVERFYRKVMAA